MEDQHGLAFDRLANLAGCARDVASIWRGAAAILASVVPHHLSPCWYTLDPASHLITSHFQEGLPEFPAEWLTEEYFGDDVNQLVQVARSPEGLSTLHEATDGDPSRSPRWHQNMRYGGDQELILALKTRDGAVWGAMGLYREPGQPLFNGHERQFLRAAAPVLAQGVRRALLFASAGEPEQPGSPAVVIVTREGAARSITPTAGAWLAALPGSWRTGTALPPAVLSVAYRAAGKVAPADATARTTTRAGSWVELHGMELEGARGDVAVIIESAAPPRIFQLLAAAYGLTERERELTGLVLRGYSTAEIAKALVVSPHTVQQHLKSIFDKTGVRSRRDLVGKVFFAHYEPRLRENERRVASGRPIRGGPAEMPHAAG
ncbi:MAG: LuxR C-terminal-related transcriptional regulator [Dehalococcoidia bacterium]